MLTVAKVASRHGLHQVLGLTMPLIHGLLQDLEVIVHSLNVRLMIFMNGPDTVERRRNGMSCVNIGFAASLNVYCLVSLKTFGRPRSGTTGLSSTCMAALASTR